MISTREAIGIAEIVIFVPLHLIAVYLSFRHSVYKQLAWLFLALLCALRIASGGLAIAVTRNPENITAAVWAVILGSIGLNPLLLATMGLLKTVCVIIYLRLCQLHPTVTNPQPLAETSKYHHFQAAVSCSFAFYTSHALSQ